MTPVVDLDRREVGIVAPLLLALVLFGFFPMPLLDVINPVVHDTLAGVGIGQEAKEAGHQ
jgi:NADH-quinone oxidoreductase subunit M